MDSPHDPEQPDDLQPDLKADMEQTALLHFATASTRVSLELPIGFEFMGEEPGQVIYRDDSEDPERFAAVVVIKALAVPEAQTDAWRGAAEAFATLPDRRVLERVESHIEGLPSVVLTSEHDEPKSGRTLVRHEVVVQASHVVFVLSGACGKEDAEECLPAFEHAFKTARLLLPLEGGFTREAGYVTSVFHEELRLSLNVPHDWTAHEETADELRLLVATKEDAEPGSAGWMTFARGAPSADDEESLLDWQAAQAEAALAVRREARENHRVLRTDRYELSSMAPVHASLERWTDDVSGEERVGLYALVVGHRHLLYTVEAEAPGAPEERGDEAVVRFAEVLRSLRILDGR